MKILIVLPKLHTGGTERASLDLAIFIKEHGYKPLFASGSRSGKMMQELLDNKIKHIYVPLHFNGLINKLISGIWLCLIAKIKNIDLIHCMTKQVSMSSFVAAALLRIPMVSTIHAAYNKKKKNRWKIDSDYRPKSHSIIAPSNFIMNYIRDDYDVNKCVLIHNWYNDFVFNRDFIDKERTRNTVSKLNIHGSKKIISLVCRLQESKGVLLFIDAFLKIEDTNIIGVIAYICNDDFIVKVKRRILVSGLSDRILLIENADIPAIYKISYAVVIPSIYPESFGLIAIEAGAMGVPVIAAAHGGVLDIIEDGVNGILIAPIDTDAISDGILHICKLSDNEYNKMSKKSLELAVNNFSSNKHACKILDLYSKLKKRMCVNG